MGVFYCQGCAEHGIYDGMRIRCGSNVEKYHDLMQRAQSLTQSGPIEFRMCRIAAKRHGFDPDDINGFVKMVPMADAEIVRLQQEEGYAYMQ